MDTIASYLAQGMEHHRHGRLPQAEAIYRQILAINPLQADAWQLLGLVAHHVGKHDLAVEYIERAIALFPRSDFYYTNLAEAQRALDRPEEAMASCRKAIELNANCATAYYNLAAALHDTNHLDEAIANLDEAIRIQPDSGNAHFHRAFLWLLEGRYRQGWAEHEWRWKRPHTPLPELGKPLWDGSSLEGRTILLCAEQGLGDTLQFARYVPLVRERGGRVLLVVQPALVRLLDGVTGAEAVYAADGSWPEFDCFAPLLSLPHFLETEVETIPPPLAKLNVDAAAVARWHEEFAPPPHFKVGIVWQGDPTHQRDRYRSFRLEEFAPLAAVPGVQLYSLQKGAGREQLAAMADRFSVIDLADRFDDFQDTAAAVANLDLVVACDTAVVHLAAGLEKPTWVALPFAPDWRWFMDRSDSPWYPTARLFRQTKINDWSDVFATMTDELRALLGERGIA